MYGPSQPLSELRVPWLVLQEDDSNTEAQHLLGLALYRWAGSVVDGVGGAH